MKNMRECLIGLGILLKSIIWEIYSQKYAIYLQKKHNDDLPSEKNQNVHNVVIVIKIVFSKNHNDYYYQLFWKNWI